MKRTKIFAVLCAMAVMTSATAVSASAMDVIEDPVNLTITAENVGDIFNAGGIYLLAQDGDVTGALVFTTSTEGQYYNFKDSMPGSGFISTPFTIEAGGETGLIFHFGAVDDITPATADGNGLTFDFGENGKVTYECTLSEELTPETFEQYLQQLADLGNTIFSRGVWAVKDADGNVDHYLVCEDATNGHIERADGTGGVPFTMAQHGFDGFITFHLGGPENEVRAAVDAATDTLTVDGKTFTYEFLMDVDPDTFTVDAPTDAVIFEDVDDAADGDVQVISAPVTATATSNAFTISGADIKAECTNNAKPICYVTFNKFGSFELFFDFTLSNGAVKRYTVNSNKTSDYVAYVPMDDMFAKLNIAAGDIDMLTISGTSIADVAKISLNKATATATTVTTSTVRDDATGDENPHTGVELMVIPALAAAGIAGGAFFMKKKHK